jgi:hypothetical protein
MWFASLLFFQLAILKIRETAPRAQQASSVCTQWIFQQSVDLFSVISRWTVRAEGIRLLQPSHSEGDGAASFHWTLARGLPISTRARRGQSEPRRKAMASKKAAKKLKQGKKIQPRKALKGNIEIQSYSFGA